MGALAQAGARVVVHYGAGKAEAQAGVAEIRESGQAKAVGADLAGPDGAQHLARHHGGGFRPPFRGQCSLALLSGPADAPDSRQWQQLVFLSSPAAHAVVGALAANAAAKGAVDTLVKHFAAALGPLGIRPTPARNTTLCAWMAVPSVDGGFDGCAAKIERSFHIIGSV